MLFYVDVCRKCLKSEVIPAWKHPPPERSLKEVPFSGGAMVFRMCDDCRSQTTLGELDDMLSENWLDSLQIDIQITVKNGDQQTSDIIPLRPARGKNRRRFK